MHCICLLFYGTGFITDKGYNQSERNGSVFPVEPLFSRFLGRSPMKMMATFTEMLISSASLRYILSRNKYGYSLNTFHQKLLVLKRVNLSNIFACLFVFLFAKFRIIFNLKCLLLIKR